MQTSAGVRLPKLGVVLPLARFAAADIRRHGETHRNLCTFHTHVAAGARC